MALSLKQQIFERLGNAKNILITCDKDINGDSVGSVFALFFIFKKLGKNAVALFNDALPEKYGFLPCAEFSVKRLNANNKLVISIKNPLKEIYYEKNERGWLKLHLSPDNCGLCKEDIAIDEAPAKFDFIITINSPDLDGLGDVFSESPAMFYDAPIINIDWKPENENFGEINLVDIAASSASEIIADTLKSFYENYLDNEIATCLLSGMVCATNNFQTSAVSPKALSLASYLMEKGADQQKIIKFLYKTKNIAELQLFGRLLARLKKLNHDFSFAALPFDDFTLTKTTTAQLATVLEDFKEQAPNFNPLIMLWENERKIIWGLVFSRDAAKIQTIEKQWGGVKKKDALFFKPRAGNLNEAELEITRYLASV